MKRVIYFVAFIATCGLGIMSCEKNMENEQPPADTGNTMEVAAAKNMLTVGEKLENPYSVANMQKAQDALQGSGMLKSSAAIEPTHLYVRFLAKNEEELDLWRVNIKMLIFVRYGINPSTIRGDLGLLSQAPESVQIQ